MPAPPSPPKKEKKEDKTSLSEPKANSEERWTIKFKKIFLSSQMHITIHLTLKVGSNPYHVTPYFILG